MLFDTVNLLMDSRRDSIENLI